MQNKSLKQKIGITIFAAAVTTGAMIGANTSSVLAEELPEPVNGTQEETPAESAAVMPQTKAEAEENLAEAKEAAAEAKQAQAEAGQAYEEAAAAAEDAAALSRQTEDGVNTAKEAAGKALDEAQNSAEQNKTAVEEAAAEAEKAAADAAEKQAEAEQDLARAEQDAEQAQAELNQAKEQAGATAEEAEAAKAATEAAQTAYEEADAAKQAADENLSEAQSKEEKAQGALDAAQADQEMAEQNLQDTKTEETQAQQALDETVMARDAAEDAVKDALNTEEGQAALQGLEDAKNETAKADLAAADAEHALEEARAASDAKEKEVFTAVDALNAVISERNDAETGVQVAGQDKTYYDKAVLENEKAVNDLESERDKAAAEETQAETALTEARAAAKKAQENETQARAALEEAQTAGEANQEAQSMAGFLSWLKGKCAGNEAFLQDILFAENVFSEKRNVQASGHTEDVITDFTSMGAEGDATSLQNIKTAIGLIRKCNDLRTAEALEKGVEIRALKVSNYLMAIAQMDTNWARKNIAHPKAYNTAENLAWGYTNPFAGWYTKEKALYDKGERDFNNVGHYLNIVDPSYTVTGMGWNTMSDSLYGKAAGQEFLGSWAYSFEGIDVDTYEELFDEYVNSAQQKKEEAEQALAAAQSACEAAREAAEEARKEEAARSLELQEKQAAVQEKETLLEKVRGWLEEARENAARSEQALSEAEQHLADLTAQQEQAQNEFDALVEEWRVLMDAIPEREADVQAARTAVEEKKALENIAQQYVDSFAEEMAANLRKAEAEVNRNQQALEEAQQAVCEAENRLADAKDTAAQARSGLEAAQAELTQAQKTAGEAAAVLEEKEAALTEAKQVQAVVDALYASVRDAEKQKAFSDAAVLAARKTLEAAAENVRNTAEALDAAKAAAKTAAAKAEAAAGISLEQILEASVEDENFSYLNKYGEDYKKALLAHEDAIRAENAAKADLAAKKMAKEDADARYEKAGTNQIIAQAVRDSFFREYSWLDGADQVIVVPTAEGAMFRSVAEYSKFLNMYVDGKEVEKTSYDLKEGSTIVNLHQDFIDGLSLGKHTLLLDYVDGTAQTTFLIKEQENVPADTAKQTVIKADAPKVTGITAGDTIKVLAKETAEMRDMPAEARAAAATPQVFVTNSAPSGIPETGDHHAAEAAAAGAAAVLAGGMLAVLYRKKQR